MTETPEKPIGFGFGFDHLAQSWFDALKQSGDVAEEALDKIQAGTFDAAAWSKSVTALVGIGVTSYVDCAEKFFDQLNNGTSPTALLRAPVDADYPRKLTILSLTRVGTSETIDNKLVSFDPETLEPGATRFRLLVSNYPYTGANFTAKIELRRTGINVQEPVVRTITRNVPL